MSAESGLWLPGPEMNEVPEVNPSLETEERLRKIAHGMQPAGYSTLLCSCEAGPHVGARMAGTPCRCEGCGFMTVEYFDALVASVYQHMDL